ncbi:hypothetical protein RMSM_01290 [Rhodopirellula maiorica SM1]|uniref:Uncharacterized protein n=1 Tax=Rhodopirellula maiorica SM1 TaxID=1265738 RepID=M5RR53_9BACT|nr:hypothetical protein RMSM_01290 [Rhodopirellula maiorica SM1]
MNGVTIATERPAKSDPFRGRVSKVISESGSLKKEVRQSQGHASSALVQQKT